MCLISFGPVPPQVSQVVSLPRGIVKLRKMATDAKDVTAAELRSALSPLLVRRDLDVATVGTIRLEVAARLGLEPAALDARREEVLAITKDLINIYCAKKSAPHSGPHAASEEKKMATKMVYLVTCVCVSVCVCACVSVCVCVSVCMVLIGCVYSSSSSHGRRYRSSFLFFNILLKYQGPGSAKITAVQQNPAYHAPPPPQN